MRRLSSSWRNKGPQIQLCFAERKMDELKNQEQQEKHQLRLKLLALLVAVVVVVGCVTAM